MLVMHWQACTCRVSTGKRSSSGNCSYQLQSPGVYAITRNLFPILWPWCICVTAMQCTTCQLDGLVTAKVTANFLVCIASSMCPANLTRSYSTTASITNNGTGLSTRYFAIFFLDFRSYSSNYHCEGFAGSHWHHQWSVSWQLSSSVGAECELPWRDSQHTGNLVPDHVPAREG